MKSIAFSVLALAFGATSAFAQQPAAGNAEHGKKLFMEIGCYQCHGVAGQGAQQTGPRISRTALPFDGFLHQIRQPLNQMPPYEAAVLPDSSVADLYAYVKSMPAPPDPKSLPLLVNMGQK